MWSVFFLNLFVAKKYNFIFLKLFRREAPIFFWNFFDFFCNFFLAAKRPIFLWNLFLKLFSAAERPIFFATFCTFWVATYQTAQIRRVATLQVTWIGGSRPSKSLATPLDFTRVLFVCWRVATLQITWVGLRPFNPFFYCAWCLPLLRVSLRFTKVLPRIR